MATGLYISHRSLATPPVVTYSPHHLLPHFRILFSLPSDFYLHFYDLVLSMFYLCFFTCALHPFLLGSISISFSQCEAEPST